MRRTCWACKGAFPLNRMHSAKKCQRDCETLRRHGNARQANKNALTHNDQKTQPRKNEVLDRSALMSETRKSCLVTRKSPGAETPDDSKNPGCALRVDLTLNSPGTMRSSARACGRMDSREVVLNELGEQLFRWCSV
jgi:hypothetical protein